jgi:hypothetical protein
LLVALQSELRMQPLEERVSIKAHTIAPGTHTKAVAIASARTDLHFPRAAAALVLGGSKLCVGGGGGIGGGFVDFGEEQGALLMH